MFHMTLCIFFFNTEGNFKTKYFRIILYLQKKCEGSTESSHIPHVPHTQFLLLDAIISP